MFLEKEQQIKKQLNSEQEQPNLLKQLKQTSQSLSQQYEQKLTQNKHLKKTIAQSVQTAKYIVKQKEVQTKKYKSLNLLVNQLQTSLQNLQVQKKSKQLGLVQNVQNKLAAENSTLRHELIKLTEKGKQDQKIQSFLKQLQLNKNKLQEFIKKSNYIETQTELIAKLKSQIRSFENQNLECRRKWTNLNDQKSKNQKNLAIFKIQLDRQKTLLKEIYDEYLEKINKSKTKIVNFNETQRQKLITQFLVEQMAIVQQKRLQIQDENRNLHYHLDNLLEQQQRVTLQNNQLNAFFLNDNRSQQSKLALKMKTRIEQLRDSLVQIEQRNSSDRINKINSNLEWTRSVLNRAKQENDFLEIKLNNIQNGKFSSLDERQIADFFTNILNSKDQRISITKDRCSTINDELRQLKMQELLLQSQINNLQEALNQEQIESQFKRYSILSKK